MKKYLALLIIVIMAVSVLGAAEIVTAQIKPLPDDGGFPKPIPGPCSISNVQLSPNPEPANWPGWGTTIQVVLRGPMAVLPQSNQVIQVTILYSTWNFDPLMWQQATYKFGRTGTEASPIAQSMSDVNHDGYKDLTLFFRAKDTGLIPGDARGILTGSIPNFVCHPGCECPAMVSRPLWVRGAVPVVVGLSTPTFLWNPFQTVLIAQ